MKKYANNEKFSVKPFKITISQEVLDDLKERLKRTRWQVFLNIFLPYLRKSLGYFPLTNFRIVLGEDWVQALTLFLVSYHHLALVQQEEQTPLT
jgi:hypothetical protein